MTPIEQHRSFSVCRGELETPRSRPIRSLDLSDDTGKRAIAQPVFGNREDFTVLPALGIKNTVWAQTDLLEPRRIEIELSQCP